MRRTRLGAALDPAAADTVAVVYMMRGAFPHQHLLAEARRPLTHARPIGPVSPPTSQFCTRATPKTGPCRAR
ncbi:hypothetical protein ACWDYJ_24760 [Streptomyces sp. NPDC003042]